MFHHHLLSSLTLLTPLQTVFSLKFVVFTTSRRVAVVTGNSFSVCNFREYIQQLRVIIMCVCALCSGALTLCDHMDCSPPGSSVHGISHARKLEWVAMPFSWDLFDPRIEPMSPMSPELKADSLLWSQQGRPYICIYVCVYIIYLSEYAIFRKKI